MIQWADTQNTPEQPLPTNAQLDSLFNGPAKSLRDVWLVNSYGKVEITSTLTGWIPVSVNHSTAAAGASGRVRSRRCCETDMHICGTWCAPGE